MPENRQLTHSDLRKLVQSESIDNLTFREIVDLFRHEYADIDSRPNPIYQIDPRNHDPVIFNSSRSSRPQSHSPGGVPGNEKPCPICSGQTTGIVDWAPLSEGFTFINKNLFPVLFPYSDTDTEIYQQRLINISVKTSPQFARGLHFLQWTSSLHDRRWSNMPIEDCVVVIKRLAALEKVLLAKNVSEKTSGETPYISIYKNAGRLVGSSITHDHQQILMSSIMPRRIADHLTFKRENGITFSEHILKNNPEDLLIADYGQAVLLVPYFMKRPYNMMLIVKDTDRAYYHDLTDSELEAAAQGWKIAITAIERVFSKCDKELAFNVITHNGQGCGLYVEFLPYMQEYGGLEHSGMFLCQSNPYKDAFELKEIIKE